MNKLRKAKLIAQLLSAVPYVRLVVLTGSVATGRDNPKSDLDFLIICQRGRLYLGRYLCVGLMTLFGQKSYPKFNKSAGRVCLTFYLADNFLDFIKINRPLFKKRQNWLKESMPLSGFQGLYKRLMKINGLKPLPWEISNIEILSALQFLFEFILAFGGAWILERISRLVASKRLEKYQKETKDKGIQFGKNYIELHLGEWK